MGGYERAQVLGRTKYYQTAQTVEGPVPVSGQGIYEESSSAKYPVGKRLCLNDGRVFYYCKNGSVALTVGRAVQTPVNRTMIANITNASAGDDYLTIDSAAATINAGDYDNGYLVIHDVGYVHKIRHSPAITSAGSGNIYLYDPIVAATTSNDCTFFKNPCHSVIALVDGDAFMIGVPLIAVTASYYFWAQTWGPCAVYCGGSATSTKDKFYELAIHKTGVSLQSAVKTGATDPQTVGYVMYDSTDLTNGTYETIYLTCMA